jgi:hypothetical protein
MSAPSAEISRYLAEVDTLYRAGNATEHSYRPALKSLLENITTGLTITNEPKHKDKEGQKGSKAIQKSIGIL